MVPADALQAGNGPDLPDADRATASPSHTGKVLARTRKNAGLKHCTMHSLRHGFASSLWVDGASLTEVQKYMGHKSAVVTLNTYAHFLPTEDAGRVRGHVQRRLGRVGHFMDTSGAESPDATSGGAVSAWLIRYPRGASNA